MKTPITAADLLNDRVLPFFDEMGISLLRMLTDRGTVYCGNPERHEYDFSAEEKPGPPVPLIDHIVFRSPARPSRNCPKRAWPLAKGAEKGHASPWG